MQSRTMKYQYRIKGNVRNEASHGCDGRGAKQALEVRGRQGDNDDNGGWEGGCLVRGCSYICQHVGLTCIP